MNAAPERLSAEDRQRASLCPPEPVTQDALRERWGLAGAQTRQTLLRLLTAGELHVHGFAPLLYAPSRPAQLPTLPSRLRRHLKALTRPVTFETLMTQWDMSRSETRFWVTHLLNTGHLIRRGRGVYEPGQIKVAPLPVLRRPTRQTAEAAELQKERLAAVEWPARFGQIKLIWGIGPNATNAYLYRMLRRGTVLRTPDGIYYLPGQPVPKSEDVPRSSRDAPEPAPLPVAMHDRIRQVTWPLSLEEAAEAWDMSSSSASQYLGRLIKRRLVARVARGHYDLTEAGRAFHDLSP